MNNSSNAAHLQPIAKRSQNHGAKLTKRVSSIFPPGFKRRLVGPGALYNIGNLLALLSGLAFQIREVWDQTSIVEAVGQHLLGSPGSLWLSGSMLIFLVSGEIYHRAWQCNPIPDPRLTQIGDLISGLAAIALTVALVWMGNAAIAIFAGVLLAGGKLGGAILPTFHLPNQATIERGFRITVVSSRLPSILALILPILQTGGKSSDMILPAITVFCFLLWLWADLLLLQRGQVVLIDRRKLNDDVRRPHNLTIRGKKASSCAGRNLDRSSEADHDCKGF